MKKYLKFGESRKEKALTNDNFFNNHLPELYITQQQNLCLFILIAFPCSNFGSQVSSTPNLRKESTSTEDSITEVCAWQPFSFETAPGQDVLLDS